VRRVDRHGRQHREDLVEEEAVEPLALVGGQLRGIEDGEAGCPQLVAQTPASRPADSA